MNADPIPIRPPPTPGLPLLAAGLAALCGVIPLPQVKENAHLPVVLAFLCSLGASGYLFTEVKKAQDTTPASPIAAGYEKVITLWTWANVPHAYDLISH